MLRSIFVSKPNSLSVAQREFCARLFDSLRSRDLNPRTLGQTDFPNDSPVNAVRTLIGECRGTVVLGLKQMLVESGLQKAHTEDEARVLNIYLPTAWNQIEAGMAFMARHPILILKEKGVSGGIFDVGNTDRFIHQAELTEDYFASGKFVQPFNAWYEEVILSSRTTT